MSLPANWTERLFAKLTVTYGQGFLRQYDGVDLEAVKANWGHELGCFQQNPQAIARGLEHLPADRAPTVLQFRELCKSQTEYTALALPAPAPADPIAPEVIAATKAAFQRKDERGWKDWAHALKRRHESGEKLSRFQVQCYREALGISPQIREVA